MCQRFTRKTDGFTRKRVAFTRKTFDLTRKTFDFTRKTMAYHSLLQQLCGVYRTGRACLAAVVAVAWNQLLYVLLPQEKERRFTI